MKKDIKLYDCTCDGGFGSCSTCPYNNDNYVGYTAVVIVKETTSQPETTFSAENCDG